MRVVDPDDPPRWWTLEEANAALDRVGAAVKQARAAAAFRANGHRQPAGGGAGMVARIVGELEAEGIVLRDITRGLIDFAARSPSGRGYWLCWVVDEPEVAWWHWPPDGFAGRRPISEPPV